MILMKDLTDVVGEEPIKLSKDFSIEEFVECYVEEALNLAKISPSIDLFDNEVRHLVSEKLGMSKSAVFYLHHSFHRAFFCDDIDSPFKYIQSTKSDKTAHIELKRDATEKDKKNLKDYILKKDSDYLSARLKTLQEAAS